MPQVATIEEVLFAAKQKQAAKQPANLLGVPFLPGLPSNSLVQAVTEMTFVGPGYTGEPFEVWALIVDPVTIQSLNHKHKEANMDPARTGLPRLPILSIETPYLIIRTVE